MRRIRKLGRIGEQKLVMIFLIDDAGNLAADLRPDFHSDGVVFDGDGVHVLGTDYRGQREVYMRLPISYCLLKCATGPSIGNRFKAVSSPPAAWPGRDSPAAHSEASAAW